MAWSGVRKTCSTMICHMLNIPREQSRGWYFSWHFCGIHDGQPCPWTTGISWSKAFISKFKFCHRKVLPAEPNHWSTQLSSGHTNWQQQSRVSDRNLPRSYLQCFRFESRTFCMQSLCSTSKQWIGCKGIVCLWLRCLANTDLERWRNAKCIHMASFGKMEKNQNYKLSKRDAAGLDWSLQLAALLLAKRTSKALINWKLFQIISHAAVQSSWCKVAELPILCPLAP